jgi:DNA-directed RNA polymerase subunit RPC12/RpoP
MKTKKIQMRVFEEHLVCEKCQMVMEQMTGILSRENVYVCPNCGHRISTPEKFPRIVYEPITKVNINEK